jgi:hypothetical protein
MTARDRFGRSNARTASVPVCSNAIVYSTTEFNWAKRVVGAAVDKIIPEVGVLRGLCYVVRLEIEHFICVIRPISA